MFRLRTVALLSATALTALVAAPVAAGAAPAPTPARAAAPWVSCEHDPNVTHPAVCLPSGLGEDEHAPLGTGDTIEFDALVVNHGVATPPGASIVITLPSTLRLATDDESDDDANPVRFDSAAKYEDGDGTELTCVPTNGGTTVTCPTGALAAGATSLIGIWLTSKPSAPAGGTGTFTVSLDPIVPDTYTPTSVTAAVDYTGAAHLTVHLAPRTVKVVVGKSVDVIATVTNNGPDPAPDSAAIGIAARPGGGTPHFAITNAPVSQSSTNNSSNRTTAAAMQVRVLKAKKSPHSGIWPLGTIAAHKTVTIPIRVMAESLGNDTLLFFAGSDAADPVCDDDNVSAECAPTTASLTAVRAPAPPSPTKRPTHHANGAGNLAASGPTTLRPQLGLALLLLLVGSGATLAARRPRTRYTARH